MEDTEIGQTLGEQGFERMVAAFYSKVKQDDLIGPMYPENDWQGAEERLRDFLIFRFGLSQRYIENRGHPRLRMRHAPFPIGKAHRDRWVELMNQAMEETDVPSEVAAHLKAFFGNVADFMRNQHD